MAALKMQAGETCLKRTGINRPAAPERLSLTAEYCAFEALLGFATELGDVPRHPACTPCKLLSVPLPCSLFCESDPEFPPGKLKPLRAQTCVNPAPQQLAELVPQLHRQTVLICFKIHFQQVINAIKKGYTSVTLRLCDSRVA